MNNRIFLPLLLIFLFTISGRAQLIDNEVWFDVSASTKLFKNAKLGLEGGYRRNEDFGNHKLIYFEPEFDYEVVKNLDLSFSYRFSVVPGPDYDENRLAGAISYSLDLGKLDISYRLKYQQDYSYGSPKVSALRNKLKFDYNLSKTIDPFLAFELFYDPGMGQQEFEQMRGLIGFDLNLPDGRDFKIYYLLKHKYNVSLDGNYNVFGFSYSFGKIKLKKKKKSTETSLE